MPLISQYSKKIRSSDVSIVVQGPIFGNINDPDVQRFTKRALISIRKQFPESELILSTWVGSDTHDLDYDILVLSKDPGSAVRDEVNNIYHNGNRQIISTINGLRKASRKYAIKTRSDVIFTHGKCLNYLHKYPVRSTMYRFTAERVLVVSVTSVNPNRKLQLPYCPCDWFYCGLKDDLIDIFTIPLFPEPEYTMWFKNRKPPHNNPFPTVISRYNPENYIWYSYLSKHMSIKFDHQYDISNNNIEISEHSFANNLVILKPSQLGIISLKNKYDYASLYYMYTHTEWKKLYNRYCQDALLDNFDYDLLLYKLADYYRLIRVKIGLRTRINKIKNKLLTNT